VNLDSPQSRRFNAWKAAARRDALRN